MEVTESNIEQLHDNHEYVNLADVDKRAILPSNLHPRVIEILETLPDNATNDKAVTALDKHFISNASQLQ